MQKALTGLMLFLLLSSLAPTSGLPDLDISTADDKTISLDQFNAEPLLFMAMTTTCSSCKMQNSYLKEVYSATQNLTILSIAMDNKIDTVETIKSYKVDQEIPWTVSLDESGEIRMFYQVNSYPQLFFVDDGEIIKRWKYIVKTDEILDTIDDYVEVGEVTEDKTAILSILFNNWIFRICAFLLLIALPTKIVVNKFNND